MGALVFFINGAHESRCWRKDFIDEDEDRLLGCQLDSFPDDINELPHSEILDSTYKARQR